MNEKQKIKEAMEVLDELTKTHGVLVVTINPNTGMTFATNVDFDKIDYFIADFMSRIKNDPPILYDIGLKQIQNPYN